MEIIESAVNPLVTVITPNYNGSRFIPRLLECVKRQKYSIEHIVVDDCSTDGSWDLLLRLSDLYPWLKPIRLKNNSGPIIARNKAIKEARGRFLAFLDVDDIWLPNKLSTQINFMLERGCVLSYSDYRFMSEDGTRIGRLLKGYSKIGFHLHHMTRYLGCLTIIVDKTSYPEFNFPAMDRSILAEDFMAWSVCIKLHGPALRCPHDLARYSVVPNSRSSSYYTAWTAVWNLYRNIECIPMHLAVIYFLVYTVGSIWKQIIYRPYFERSGIDSDFQWSLINNQSSAG